MFCLGRSSRFLDVLDAQWECEGDLIPLEPSVLHAGELLVYEHGLFLIATMSNLSLVRAKTYLDLCEKSGSLPLN